MMFSQLNDLANKHRILGVPIKVGCFVGLAAISRYNNASGAARARGLGSGRFDSLKNYKSRYVGKRCFIVCTGPSLTIADLSLIKNEFTFGMNSICKLYDETDFRPTFYGIQDQFVYRTIESVIQEHYSGADNVFVSDRVARYNTVDPMWNQFPLSVAYSAYDCWFRNRYWARFSEDIHREVYNGFSITFSLIEIAVYMGFEEIYLLGADNSFSKDKRNHVVEYGLVDSQIDTAQARNLAGYRAAADYIKDKPIHIYNVTRGGDLEIFPRRRLEDVLGA